MAEQRLHSALAPVDILTRLELEEVMHKGMQTFFQQEQIGVSYKEYNGSADGANSVQIPGPDSGYAWALKLVAAILTGGAAGPVPSQPAVPASTVAAQNVNAYPVQVVISGGTATVTSVNGIVVGAGDGTFTVPAYGSIAVTYSVAPTWVWSNASGTAAPTVALFMGENATTAPIDQGPGILAGGLYSVAFTFTSNVVVMSDQRVVTLQGDASSNIGAYKLIAKQVPAEMVGKL